VISSYFVGHVFHFFSLHFCQRYSIYKYEKSSIKFVPLYLIDHPLGNRHITLNFYFFLQDKCRHLEFQEALQGKRLVNHVIMVHDVTMEDFCDVLCYMEHSCASCNLMSNSETKGHRCELNNATYEEYENDLEENPDYKYHGTKVTMTIRNSCKYNNESVVIL